MARAQTSPVLAGAVQLAAAGRTDSARAIVAGVLARARAGDTLYVEALYTRGRLASTADSAERDLRRVAIEFSTSKWAPDAMLHLAQLAMTTGNPAGALQYAERLRNDYPDSPLRPQAALWGGRAAFDTNQPQEACSLLDSARAEAASDIEFQNQVGFFRERCTAVTLAAPAADTTPAAPDSARRQAPDGSAADTVPAAAPRAGASRASAPPPPRDTTSAAASAPEHGFSVQVAAPRSQSQARGIAQRFSQAGYPAHVVPGPHGVYRVRLGPYPTLRAAQGIVTRAGRLVREKPFVVRE